MRGALLSVSGVLLIVAIVVLVRLVNDTEAPDTPPTAELSHIHGMAVNPADNLLYVATHGGLFTVDEDGSAALVGEGRQDTMGFTIIGPDHFIASGHPAPGQDAPGLLGLLESTDGGVTWETVSLSGEADFHALKYAHENAYGFNSATGQLLVSADLTEWEARASQPLIDFALNPSLPDSMVGAGPEGPLSSTDGGRTWTPLTGEMMVFLHWSDDGVLWGVGMGGEIYRSDDQGVTWGPMLGSAEAEPAALTAVGDTLYLATRDARILVSEDNAQTWREFYRPAS
jgi:hypothetical protein